MEFSHPPLEFALYGLAGEWGPPRWLDHVEGRLGWPAEGVWLRHGSPRPRDVHEPWLQVATFRRDRYEHRPEPISTPSDAAYTASLTLLDTTMPEPSQAREGYADQLGAAAQARADRHAEWPEVSWTLDGEVAPASVFSFAGAWAGFTRAVPEVDIVVVGFGFEPDGLALARVVDASAYHFDADRPLRFPQSCEQARAAALAPLGLDPEERGDEWWPAHPDHESNLA